MEEKQWRKSSTNSFLQCAPPPPPPPPPTLPPPYLQHLRGKAALEDIQTNVYMLTCVFTRN